MQFGLAAGPLPSGLLYAAPIQAACIAANFSPVAAYCVAMRETIRGQIEGQWNALTIVAEDNGKGLFQVTQEDWWTEEMIAEWTAIDFTDPHANAAYALKWFLVPALQFWAGQIGLTGDALLKCVADEFNAGRNAVIKAHALGNADAATTEHDYGSDIVANYHRIEAGLAPQ